MGFSKKRRKRMRHDYNNTKLFISIGAWSHILFLLQEEKVLGLQELRALVLGILGPLYTNPASLLCCQCHKKILSITSWSLQELLQCVNKNRSVQTSVWVVFMLSLMASSLFCCYSNIKQNRKERIVLTEPAHERTYGRLPVRYVLVSW